MRPPAFSRQLLALSLFGLMILSPANAQTSSEPEGRELGAFALGAGTINPGTPDTGPYAATPTPESNEKVESEPGTQPEPGPNSGPNAAIPETKEKADSEPGTQPESDPSTAQPESEATGANPELTQDGSQILINIDKSRQEMTVFIDGIEKYTWPVSTGRRGYSTPSGTYTPTSMNEVWYSKQWDNSPMPHSIFFMKDGHAIHGSHEVKNLGKPVSHGCVRISPENAAVLYDLVKTNGMENTKVVLAGVTPGDESNVPDEPAYSNNYGTAPWGPGPGYFPPPPPRRGLFGGWFRGPYGGPQGYYRPPRGYYRGY